MEGDRRSSAAIAPPQGGPAWRRLIAWLRLLLKAVARRYGEAARWRPAFLLSLALLAERGLRRAYLSWKESRLTGGWPLAASSPSAGGREPPCSSRYTTPHHTAAAAAEMELLLR
uniref:Uncharacterized protein n=1 Tax=Oryza brachyantha TaxID=4533 RepID=J3L1D7_ORYBR